MARLTGGSAGVRSREYKHPFFKSGVKNIQFRPENRYRVRLLPAFDPNLTPDDPRFKASFTSYRDATFDSSSKSWTANSTDDKGHGKFSAWFCSLQGHQFIGRESRGFLSPLTEANVTGRDSAGVDPLLECYKAAKRDKKQGRGRWNHIVDPAPNSKYAILKRPAESVIYNVLAADEQGNWGNAIAIASQAAHFMLIEQLNTYRPAIVNAGADPEWPQYLLGDVTSPVHGLIADVRETTFSGENKANMTTSGFHFCKNEASIQDIQRYPLDLNSWGQNVLSGRYDIVDLDTVLDVAPAEAILDYIVNDGTIPYDLIVEACSNYWTVPVPRRAVNVQVGALPGQSAGYPAPGQLPLNQQPAGQTQVGYPAPGQPAVQTQMSYPAPGVGSGVGGFVGQPSSNQQPAGVNPQNPAVAAPMQGAVPSPAAPVPSAPVPSAFPAPSAPSAPAPSGPAAFSAPFNAGTGFNPAAYRPPGVATPPAPSGPAAGFSLAGMNPQNGAAPAPPSAVPPAMVQNPNPVAAVAGPLPLSSSEAQELAQIELKLSQVGYGGLSPAEVPRLIELGSRKSIPATA